MYVVNTPVTFTFTRMPKSNPSTITHVMAETVGLPGNEVVAYFDPYITTNTLPTATQSGTLSWRFTFTFPALHRIQLQTTGSDGFTYVLYEFLISVVDADAAHTTTISV